LIYEHERFVIQSVHSTPQEPEEWLLPSKRKIYPAAVGLEAKFQRIPISLDVFWRKVLQDTHVGMLISIAEYLWKLGLWREIFEQLQQFGQYTTNTLMTLSTQQALPPSRITCERFVLYDW